MVKPSLSLGEIGLTLKLKVGRKGYIILPKRVREAVGIEEGDYVIVEVSDAIIIRPAAKRVNPREFREKLRSHAEKLRALGIRREVRPGELADIDLEEEFDDEGVP